MCAVCRILLAFVALRAAGAAASPMKVWAIGDTVRVDPIRSQPVEESPELFPDGIRPGYKQANLIWDGNSQRISLRAARNETIAFQIIIERTVEKLTDVSLALGELAGPSGVRIPSANVDLFREWYLFVKNPSSQSYTLGSGWYADGLLPCLRWTGNLYPHALVMPFDLPDPLNNVGARQTSQAMWVDIYVPKDRSAAPPGKYSAPITVTSTEGQQRLTLELQVWDFALPEQSHLKPNIHTNTEINTLSEDMELKYYQLLRKHRLAMYPLGYAPALKVTGTKAQIDWKKYDARLGKYLDGSAFTSKFGYNGPGYGVPIEFLVLPFDAYAFNVYKRQAFGREVSAKEFKFYAPWPVPVPREGRTPEYAEIWKSAFQAVQQHFDEHPAWDKTRLLVFLLSLDESYDDESVERMIYYGQLLKESGARRLEYRIDGGYSKGAMERLSKVLDVIIVALGGWDHESVNALKKSGVDPWLYTLAGWMDGDGLNCRSMSWIAWQNGAGSWTLWELDFNSLRAWTNPEAYSSNGHGMLVYRGETMGLDDPAASIRLKGLRRGSQDYEYFWLLSQTPAGKAIVRDAVNSIIPKRLPLAYGRKISLGSPGMWRHNPDEWDKVRLRLGDEIEKRAVARQ
jgi:hypothetical protein